MIKFCRKSFSVLRPDICIVGAGPAGAAFACALASSNMFNPQAEKRIVLVDPSSLPDIKTYQAAERIPEPRVVTLSPVSLRLLRSIGALECCNHAYVTPFTDMLVYEQAGSAYMRFNNSHQSFLVQSQKFLASALGAVQEPEQYMGASIENQHLQAGLLERLRQTDKALVIPHKVKTVTPANSSAQRPQIVLEDGSIIEP